MSVVNQNVTYLQIHKDMIRCMHRKIKMCILEFSIFLFKISFRMGGEMKLNEAIVVIL